LCLGHEQKRAASWHRNSYPDDPLFVHIKIAHTSAEVSAGTTFFLRNRVFNTVFCQSKQLFFKKAEFRFQPTCSNQSSR